MGPSIPNMPRRAAGCACRLAERLGGAHYPLNFATTTSDKRPLYVVASDGGLLAEPVKVDESPV